MYISKRETVIPIWEKYALSINEAAAYFHIGEKALRRFAAENSDADFLLMVGSKTLIKREKMEEYLDRMTVI